MDQTTQLLVMVIAAAIGMLAVIAILRRDRRTAEDAEREARSRPAPKA